MCLLMRHLGMGDGKYSLFSATGTQASAENAPLKPGAEYASV